MGKGGIEMNALELADELKEWVSEFEDFAWLAKHEAMLRQQQAEIEALRAKTLTDEEIFDIAIDTNVGGSDQSVLDFARAILRKAQE
jgi:hypothetical protein